MTPDPESRQGRTDASRGVSLYVLLLLTLLHTLSLTDRFLIAAFGTQISLDLGLSNQQFGFVTGLAFTLFYATTGPLAGLMVDRFGPGRLLGLGVLVWSAMTGLTGVAKSFTGLWLPRTLVGVGEAILIPAASKILSARFDDRHSATVFGLFFMGGHLGVGLAYRLGGSQSFAGEPLVWREVFLGLGALGLCLGLLVWLSVRWLGVTAATASNDGDRASLPILVRTLMATLVESRRLQLALLGLALVHVLYAGMQFLQIWLVQDKGLAPGEASALYGRVHLMTAIPASLLGGIAADQLARRLAVSRALFVAGVILLCLPLIIAFRLSPADSPLFMPGMVISVFAFSFPYGAMIALVVAEAPESIKALVMAAALFLANVGVIGLGTFLLGAGADWMAAADISAPMTRALLAADSLLVLAAVVFLLLHMAINRRRD